MRSFTSFAVIFLVPCALLFAETLPTAEMVPAGDWQVRVSLTEPAVQALVEIQPPQEIVVSEEKYNSLPLYNPNGGGWNNGARLRQLLAEECTTPGLLDPDSVVLRAGTEATSRTFVRGSDYEIDTFWATFGRLAGGAIGESTPIFASYRYTPQRLDSVILTTERKIDLRSGKAAVVTPALVDIGPGERRLGNVWVFGKMPRLTGDHLFPVSESAFPEPPAPAVSVAEKLVPRTFAKLRSGKPLRILA
ncbi:MAG: hypothetical protein EOP84_09965, partial [Verrucomicrobiaceae bacterium]